MAAVALMSTPPHTNSSHAPRSYQLPPQPVTHDHQLSHDRPPLFFTEHRRPPPRTAQGIVSPTPTHTDASATVDDDVGGARLLLPPPHMQRPAPPVKSYGTTSSDISDPASLSTGSAVVAMPTSLDAVDSPAAVSTAHRSADGIDTRSSGGSTPPAATQHGWSGYTGAAAVPAYDPHRAAAAAAAAAAPGTGDAQEPQAMPGGGNGTTPAAGALAGGMAAAAGAPRRLTPGMAALLGNGPAPSFSTAASPSHTGPPPTFMQLAVRRLQSTSPLQFLWVLMLMVMLLVGNAFQVIFLNFWIHEFPTKPVPTHAPRSSSSAAASTSGGGGGGEERAEALASSYTTFVISAALFPAFFIVLSIAYAVWRRPNLAFAREWSGWWMLLGIGALDTLNSAMAIYAAAHTPEVLQALFVSLVPIYSAVFTKWFLKDPRNYANPFIAVSFSLIAAGVGLASLFGYITTHRNNSDTAGDGLVALLQHVLVDGPPSSAAAVDRQIWCIIFFFSVPPTVLMNVWQTKYMIRYTSDPSLITYLEQRGDEDADEDDEAAAAASQHTRLLGGHERAQQQQQPSGAAETGIAATAAASPRSSGSSSAASDTSAARQCIRRPRDFLLQGEDTSVKLVMLASDTAIQAFLAFALLPMDALPWFGGSDSIREAVQNLDEGIDCVLHCPKNMRYCLLYSMGFVLVYIASAYLNRYSVTLCSMVSQLSGPITALVLVAVPSLNMTGDASPWYVSVLAVLLLSCGTVTYVYWDEMTAEEKEAGEMELKWAMMREQARAIAAEETGSVDDSSASTSPSQQQQQQQHRRSRSRRFRRRRQSDYVVVVDRDAAGANPAGQQQQ
ncbi:hypothetical protein NESM_000870400 [Novymonas esmeraldas]|uniref:Uncharacterized protein n=1 Tax=Novymonas esmeraldas TaxID=1808958 RepID=A0AAW0EXJ6_9TRYP